MPMTGFICHDNYLAKTAKLTDEEVGRLFRALMAYHATGEANEIDGRESIAFDFIREDIDRTEEAYKAKCETNRRNRASAKKDEGQRSITVDNDRERPTVKEKENININKKKKEYANERFEKFWSAYPRHEAKQTALRAFVKLNPDEELLEKMILAVEKQKGSAQWKENGGQFIPHPSTWLNQHRWEDEVKDYKPDQKKLPAQDYEQRDYSGYEDEALNRIISRWEEKEKA